MPSLLLKPGRERATALKNMILGIRVLLLHLAERGARLNARRLLGLNVKLLRVKSFVVHTHAGVKRIF